MSSGDEHSLPRSGNLLLYRRSILEKEVLKEAFKQKFDYIFHLAAQFANQNSVDYPCRDLLTNGMGTLKLLQYAVEKGVGRFIFASSSCVVGKQTVKEPTTIAHLELDTPYAITKLLGEHYVYYFHRQYGLPTVTLRYFNSFGPGEYPGKYRGVIPNFFQRALSGKPLIITGTGDETRDFNYCQNTVDGTLLAALSDDAVGRVFNIGSGVETGASNGSGRGVRETNYQTSG